MTWRASLGLAVELLNRADPVLDVVPGRDLVARYGEHIDGHRLEAPPRGPGAKELAHRSPGRFATHDHTIARDHDVPDAPGQVRDARADLLEHFRQRIARLPLLVGRIRLVVRVAGLREKGSNVLVLGLVQCLVEWRDDLARPLYGELRLRGREAV